MIGAAPEGAAAAAAAAEEPLPQKRSSPGSSKGNDALVQVRSRVTRQVAKLLSKMPGNTMRQEVLGGLKTVHDPGARQAFAAATQAAIDNDVGHQIGVACAAALQENTGDTRDAASVSKCGKSQGEKKKRAGKEQIANSNTLFAML